MKSSFTKQTFAFPFVTLFIHEEVPLFWDEYSAQLCWQCQELNIAPPGLDKDKIRGFTNVKLRIQVEDEWGTLSYTSMPYTPIQAPLKVCLVPDPQLPFPHLKTRFTLQREALLVKGFDDVITVSDEGYLLEAIFGNIFWIIGERLYTPARVLPLYFGLTLQRLLKSWKGEVQEVKAKTLPPNASCFRSSSVQGIVPFYF